VGERVVAVVLAAGAGSRFGGGKLLASLEGRPILQHVLDRLAAAGSGEVIVVLGEDADDIEVAISWRDECRVRNPEPARGLSSSLRVGIAAVPLGVGAVLVVLGDQPRVSAAAIRALVDAGVDTDRPIAVPVYVGDGGRNPVLMGREAFALVQTVEGDRGLGPILAAHPELVREVPIPPETAPDGNPDLDTRAELVAMLETAWAARVHANNAQVDRFRETPDGADFYAPVTSLFRADPTRTDEPALEVLRSFVRDGETWLDIGAGAGRYALPIARELAPSGGEVLALDTSAAMLAALGEIAAEHGIDNVRTIQGRWPPLDGDLAPYRADVALIAHVSYDIADIGSFVRAMESSARRLGVAVLMERQPSSIADVCWPTVWGEERVPLPALPEFVELLRAMGRDVEVVRLEREPRRFASADELAGFLRRQLWVEQGSAADIRFLDSLEPLLETDADGRVGLVGQRPLPIGIVTWAPRGEA